MIDLAAPHSLSVAEPSNAIAPDVVADGVPHQLEPAFIRIAYITTASWLLVSTPLLVLAIVLALRFAPMTEAVRAALWPLLATKLLFNIVKGYYWPKLEYKHARYVVDEHGVQVRSGVLTRVTTNVPRSRVQHVDLSQGVWERRYNLASLLIHTAASGNSETKLEGVTQETAARIRDYLMPQDTNDAV